MYDKCMINARRLGLPLKKIGVPWFQIMDIEESLKKKYKNDDDLDKLLEDNIIKLQNAYYKMEEEEKQKIKEKEDKKMKEDTILKEKKRIEEEKLIEEDKILKEKILIEEDKKMKEEYRRTRKEKKKKKKEEARLIREEEERRKEEERIKEEKILEEIEKVDKINKRKRENKLEEIENKKNKENIKKLKNRIETLNKGDMDVIQNDKETKNNNIQEYYYHLKEQIISIDYDESDETFDAKGFKDTLISIILKEKEKIENIRKITKCKELFFDTKNNYFKIIVIKQDKEHYKKIINATMLISNMILKIRERIEKGIIHFSFERVALMF